MIINNREIEKHYDDLNITYFLTGDKPMPKIFIDLIEGYIYTCFGENSFGEKMYWRENYEEEDFR